MKVRYVHKFEVYSPKEKRWILSSRPKGTCYLFGLIEIKYSLSSFEKSLTLFHEIVHFFLSKLYRNFHFKKLQIFFNRLNIFWDKIWNQRKNLN